MPASPLPPPPLPPPQWEPPPVQQLHEKSNGVLALVLAIASFFTCGLLVSIPAIILARGELKGIRAGRRNVQGLGVATAAFWIGLINVGVSMLAVVAILVALFLPTVFGQVDRARLTRAKADVTALSVVVHRMGVDTGLSSPDCFALKNAISPSAPAACGRVKNCSVTPPGYVCWDGPYMSKLPNDPWNNPYEFSVDLGTGKVTVSSNGPDQTRGTEDDITETVWSDFRHPEKAGSGTAP